MTPALSVENFRKTYGNFVAVDDLSFHVNQGDIYGFLGPNGAGKSTT
ncbi:MAG: ATP-binding cassette domain-containing protein, partial [Bacteroidia bacterium]|nr:ATP-binding cassette domain-containing protein [Bacteroidia bacterium]